VSPRRRRTRRDADVIARRTNASAVAATNGAAIWAREQPRDLRQELPLHHPPAQRLRSPAVVPPRTDYPTVSGPAIAPARGGVLSVAGLSAEAVFICAPVLISRPGVYSAGGDYARLGLSPAAW
jgi:hypothetical protein